ncbi:uncharacterized protein [Diadema antillarum]|uniref:uncharacterized protein n=1 Tax=Diadema antillarum TaxID=105358 RepID=UPI003A83E204
MGLNPSFPIPVPKTNISFEAADMFTSNGKEKKRPVFDKTGFESATEKNFHRFVEQRRKAKLAKQKFEDLDGLMKKFKAYTLGQIEDFKMQFMTFDVNQDGLIDFPELVNALDELGDTSSIDERLAAFSQIDTDNSDSIDFEEFMQLLTTVASKDGSLSQAIGNMCKRGSHFASIYRTMPVHRQLELKLF